MNTEETIREDFERRRNERLQLEQLLAHPGWNVLRLALQGTWVVRRLDEHNAPISLDGSFARAKAVGAVEALEHVMKLPETLIENCRVDEAALLDKIEDMNAEKNNA